MRGEPSKNLTAQAVRTNQAVQACGTNAKGQMLTILLRNARYGNHLLATATIADNGRFGAATLYRLAAELEEMAAEQNHRLAIAIEDENLWIEAAEGHEDLRRDAQMLTRAARALGFNL